MFFKDKNRNYDKALLRGDKLIYTKSHETCMKLKQLILPDGKINGAILVDKTSPDHYIELRNLKEKDCRLKYAYICSDYYFVSSNT